MPTAAAAQHDSVLKVNFLERLWAYLTIQDLLGKVAKGQMSSCSPDEEQQPAAARPKRAAIIDDEDYDDEDYPGSGQGQEGEVEDIMDAVGDSDVVICDNLEHALYLSLKYEFVTPLTSLVVVKPDNGKEEGDIGEAGAPENIRLLSSAAHFESNFIVIAAIIILQAFYVD